MLKQLGISPILGSTFLLRTFMNKESIKLHVVIPVYYPNTATTNRIMALLKGLSSHGFTTKVTFLLSDMNDSKVQEIIPHVSFEYMWEKSLFNRRFFCRFLEKINNRKFVKNLPTGASVLLPYPSTKLMSLLVKRKDLRVFYEVTELPELYKIRDFDLKEFYKSITRLDGIFVISSSLKDYFIKLGIPANKVQIVNMFVDESRFKHTEKKKCKDRYLAYCGTVSSNKDGVDDLIRAFATIQKRHPDIRLYIIGGIPKEKEKNAFFRLVDDFDLQDSVHFTGMVSYKNMPQVLKNAEVLVLSRPDNKQAKYGFPTKLGEYLLTGNPVVVTGVGDIPLYLKDGESAMIAKPNNPQDFADKVCWLLEHPDTARKIGERGKNMARVSFNNEIEAQKVVKFISSKS